MYQPHTLGVGNDLLEETASNCKPVGWTGLGLAGEVKWQFLYFSASKCYVPAQGQSEAFNLKFKGPPYLSPTTLPTSDATASQQDPGITHQTLPGLLSTPLHPPRISMPTPILSKISHSSRSVQVSPTLESSPCCPSAQGFTSVPIIQTWSCTGAHRYTWPLPKEAEGRKSHCLTSPLGQLTHMHLKPNLLKTEFDYSVKVTKDCNVANPEVTYLTQSLRSIWLIYFLPLKTSASLGFNDTTLLILLYLLVATAQSPVLAHTLLLYL